MDCVSIPPIDMWSHEARGLLPIHVPQKIDQDSKLLTKIYQDLELLAHIINENLWIKLYNIQSNLT